MQMVVTRLSLASTLFVSVSNAHAHKHTLKLSKTFLRIPLYSADLLTLSCTEEQKEAVTGRQ